MRKFPLSESKILALAKDMVGGLDANNTAYPSPPVISTEIREVIGEYYDASDAVVAAQAEAKAATVGKQVVVDKLIKKLKQNIRYAENVTDFNDEQLALIGWSGRRSRTTVEVPGPPPLLTLTGATTGDVNLEWQKPNKGGVPAAYRVEYRHLGSETWNLAGMAIEPAVTLTQQPRSQSLEYRVVAMNKAGSSPASNLVAVVL